MSAAGMNARLMKLGIPVVFQNIIIGVGGLVVQYVINGYGFLFCGRIYSYKQALWSVGNGSDFLWICHRYLCGPESGSRKD